MSIDSTIWARVYSLCAAIDNLHFLNNSISNEHGAEERLRYQLQKLKEEHLPNVDEAYLWNKYRMFVRDCEESRVLARIESGDIDHATVKFPASVKPTNAMRLALEMLLNHYLRGAESGDWGNRDPQAEDVVIRAKEALKEIVARDNRVSIPLPDAQAMLDMFKSHNAAELSDGAVGMGDDLELAERVEAAIATARGTTTGRVSSAAEATSNTQKPATVATVTIHKGAVEQVLFNLAHGLPDGVYGLVKP